MSLDAPRTLLIVDDEPEIREVVATVANRLTPRVRVLVAGDAVQAEAVIRTEPVDGLLTDLRMPGPSGIDLLQWTAKNSPSTRCALMTGFHEEVIDGISLEGLGLVGVLRKPFTARDLRDLLSALAA